jgi:hypothetical protein
MLTVKFHWANNDHIKHIKSIKALFTEYKKNTNTSTLKQYNQHTITKLKHIMQAKRRKGL